MTTILAIRPPWIQLHDILPHNRADFDVTGFRHQDGSYTTLSKYGDTLWNFSGYLPRSNPNRADTLINFDVVLSGDKTLLSPEYQILLESSKAFLYARWMHKGPSSKKFISAATLIGEWGVLKDLLSWMIKNNVESFRKLTANVCQKYANEVKQAISENGWAVSTAVRKVEILYKIYEYREYLEDHPPRHPWPEESSVTLMGKSRLLGHYDASTEIIPRRLYVEIGKKALDFIETEGSVLLVAYEEFLKIQAEDLDKIRDLHDYRLRRRDRRKLNPYNALETDLANQMRTSFPKFAAKFGFNDLNHFWSEIEVLRTCCYVVCAIFSGMRDSELCSLKMGSFFRSLGFENEEYCWLSGTTYKMEADPRPARWMVPEIVERAVHVSSQLAKPINLKAEHELHELLSKSKPDNDDEDRTRALRIIELNKIRGNLFVNWKGRQLKAISLTNTNTNRCLKILSRRFNLTVQTEDLSEIRNKRTIKIGDIWPLATHQFRRTFAVFVARNMLGDVRYLRHHFKHWSIDMTLYYASDPLFDDSLLETTISARDALQASVLSDWLVNEKPLAGGRAQHIMQFKERRHVKTAKDPKSLAKTVGDGVFIRGTGHSWCLATAAGCGGEGLYDAIRCVRCSESVIDQSHVAIWKEIRNQQIETMTWPDMGIPTIERAKNHIREAESVLMDLGETIQPYDFLGVANDQ